MQRVRPLNWVQWLSLLLALTVAFTTPILYLRIAHIQSHENDALREILCFAEVRVRETPRLSTMQRRQAILFYRQALVDAHLKPCK